MGKMSFNESSLEIAIKNLLEKKGYPHYSGKHNFQNHELLIFGDFSNFLINKYYDTLLSILVLFRN